MKLSNAEKQKRYRDRLKERNRIFINEVDKLKSSISFLAYVLFILIGEISNA